MSSCPAPMVLTSRQAAFCAFPAARATELSGAAIVSLARNELEIYFRLVSGYRAGQFATLFQVAGGAFGDSSLYAHPIFSLMVTKMAIETAA